MKTIFKVNSEEHFLVPTISHPGKYPCLALLWYMCCS